MSKKFVILILHHHHKLSELIFGTAGSKEERYL
jgi:hypothetical protein